MTSYAFHCPPTDSTCPPPFSAFPLPFSLPFLKFVTVFSLPQVSSRLATVVSAS